MVNVIKVELKNLVLSILDDTKEREIDKVTVELRSNLGEVKTYEFSNIEKAVEFLNTTELKKMFLSSDSLTLFDPSPFIDESNA